MKVSTKKKISELKEYLEELGMFIWELNQKDDEELKELAKKMQLCYTVCMKQIKQITKENNEE